MAISGFSALLAGTRDELGRQEGCDRISLPEVPGHPNIIANVPGIRRMAGLSKQEERFD